MSRRRSSSDVEKGSALERIDEFAKEKGLSIKPRQTLPPLSELSLVKNAEGKDVPPTLTAEETAARFEGRYAQILDATLLPQDPAKKYTTDDKGIVYNERHVPLAQQGGTCVYMPLLPHKSVCHGVGRQSSLSLIYSFIGANPSTILRQLPFLHLIT